MLTVSSAATAGLAQKVLAIEQMIVEGQYDVVHAISMFAHKPRAVMQMMIHA